MKWKLTEQIAFSVLCSRVMGDDMETLGRKGVF